MAKLFFFPRRKPRQPMPGDRVELPMSFMVLFLAVAGTAAVVALAVAAAVGWALLKLICSPF